jgi:uncharacterized protein (DUF983 family)
MDLKAVLKTVRARWRWFSGRCPQCRRRLHAAFAHYRTDAPNCTVCKDETAKDLRVWRAYQAVGITKTPS